MRLIDADALEKDMRAYADNKAYCGHIELANGILKGVGRIELAPTIETAPRWIPVTERLPGVPDGWKENPEPVLYMMESTGIIYAGYYGENGTYRDKYFRQYHNAYEGVDANDVLYWMWQHDLPHPPEDGGAENGGQ